ncbi:hypothetical protein SKAU_G00211020, partial [Synaphobranchus kaupii]
KKGIRPSHSTDVSEAERLPRHPPLRHRLTNTKMAASVREKQTAALKRMLNFNAPPMKNTAAEPVWKVLIYDRFGQDIISPLLAVKELRDMGITLHLLLHSDRDPIPDVPAIYFVLPTEENIQRICQDLRNQLYESYYLNFISAISRSKLEDIASAALGANAVNQVTKVFDQYLNFITLEDDMFVLCNQNKELISYHAINKPDIMDTDMEVIMDTIVDSLFCFFVTLGAVPVIRCPRGNAAEMVAVKLDKKLRENLRDARNSLFTGDTMGAGQFSFQRPLFVLADRNLDLATPLHHTWTYQALIHDVLALSWHRPWGLHHKHPNVPPPKAWYHGTAYRLHQRKLGYYRAKDEVSTCHRSSVFHKSISATLHCDLHESESV